MFNITKENQERINEVDNTIEELTGMIGGDFKEEKEFLLSSLNYELINPYELGSVDEYEDYDQFVDEILDNAKSMNEYQLNSKLESVISTMYEYEEDKSIEMLEEHAELEYLIDVLQVPVY